MSFFKFLRLGSSYLDEKRKRKEEEHNKSFTNLEESLKYNGNYIFEPEQIEYKGKIHTAWIIKTKLSTSSSAVQTPEFLSERDRFLKATLSKISLPSIFTSGQCKRISRALKAEGGASGYLYTSATDKKLSLFVDHYMPYINVNGPCFAVDATAFVDVDGNRNNFKLLCFQANTIEGLQDMLKTFYGGTWNTDTEDAADFYYQRSGKN